MIEITRLSRAWEFSLDGIFLGQRVIFVARTGLVFNLGILLLGRIVRALLLLTVGWRRFNTTKTRHIGPQLAYKMYLELGTRALIKINRLSPKLTR